MEQYNKFSDSGGMSPNYFQPLFSCLSDLCCVQWDYVFRIVYLVEFMKKQGLGVV